MFEKLLKSEHRIYFLVGLGRSLTNEIKNIKKTNLGVFKNENQTQDVDRKWCLDALEAAFKEVEMILGLELETAGEKQEENNVKPLP